MGRVHSGAGVALDAGRVVVAVLVVLCSCSVPGTVHAQSQTGFLNIDCGATEKYVDDATGLTWVPDAPYITTGKTHTNLPLTSSLQSYTEMRTLRYFDDPSRPRNCYTLPGVLANMAYIVRVTFFYGNYDNVAKPPSFQLAIDTTIVDNVTTSDGGQYAEYTYTATGDTTFVCLIRTSPQSTPFLSGITLKPATFATNKAYADSFGKFLTNGVVLKTRMRVNFGGTEVIRFPDDVYDRIWFPEGPSSYLLSPNTSPVQAVSTNSTLNAYSVPPAVMQTAITTSGILKSYLLPAGESVNEGESPAYVATTFAELNSSGDSTSRGFEILMPWNTSPSNVTLTGFLDYTGWDFSRGNIKPNDTMVLTPYPTSVRGPIINSMEIFVKSQQPQAPRTIERDALAIIDIKLSLNLTEWSGDPCSPSPYPWLTCSSLSATVSQPQITTVNLSGYHLQGTLHASFADLQDLTSLRLENNNLSGPLPEWLTSLKRLKVLSIQNNNFSGPIPASLLSTSDTLDFTYLPGNPLLTGPRPVNSGSKSSSSISIPAIVGVSIGGVLGLVLVSVLVFWAVRQCKRKPKLDTNSSLTPSDFPEPSTRPIIGSKGYTLAEVTAATKNFKTELGKGGFGPVFYGKLSDGQEVAVKVADGSTRQGEREFFNEVGVLSKVHHKNLVALVGYCQEDKKQILIYEYMNNGSLFDRLHGKKLGSGTLDWKTRLNIALNAAQGLEYLHTGCKPSFIHRDIKSGNILLTPSFDAKVADFGLTRLMGETEGTRVMTMVMGTAGYLDPEYYSSQYISTKSDVFSFGVVLLELITGRLPIDRSVPVSKYPNICEWVRESLKSSDIDSIMDPVVTASHPNYEAVWKVVEIAMRSVEPKSIHRPTMTEVVQELNHAVTMEGASAVPPLHSRMPSGYSDYSNSSQYPSISYPSAR